MKKKTIAILLMVCAVITTACSGVKNDKSSSGDAAAVETQNAKAEDTKYFTKFPSKLDKDDYVICTYENNQEIYKGMTANAGFVFHILSSEELKDGDVKVDMNCKNKYTLSKDETEHHKGKFAMNVCMLYNDIDWGRLKKLQMSDKKEDKDEFIKIDNDMDDEYSTLKDDQFPEYYDNEYGIQFEIKDEFVNEEINSMTLNIKGKEYTLDIGRLIFYDSYESADDAVSDVCYFSEYGRINYDIYYNKNGEIELSLCELSADKDVVIKDIKILNKDKSMSLKEVNFESDVDGVSLNQVWKKGNDIPVKGGETLTMNFIVQDKNFCEKECYGANVYIDVEYELDGKIYTASNQAICHTKYDNETLYAMFKDGVDTKVYLAEYLAE